MGIVEVRVHGVSGTSPDQLLDDPHPRLVTGDALSGFYRPRAGRQPDDRTVHEAYAWGGLTSGSPWRALWVLLAPFALVNAAASMHRTRAKVARPLTRLLALSLTTTLVLSTYVLSADLFAWQCGSDTACVERHSYTRFLGWTWLNSPGRRLVVAMLLPIGVVCLLWALGRATWQRAEAFVPEPTVMPRVIQTPFDHPQLWDGRARGIFLRHIHVGCAVATLAALLSFALRETTGSMSAELVVAIAMLIVIVLLAIPEVPAHVDRRRNLAALIVLALSWLTLLRIMLFAWSEPDFHALLPEQLPGSNRTVTYLFVAQLVAILLLLVTSRWPAAAVSFVALSLGAAFGAGLVIGVGLLLGDLGTRELRLPIGISWAARAAALLAALVLFVALVFVAVLTARRFGGRPPLDPLTRARNAARRTDKVPVYTAVVMAVLVPLFVGATIIVVAIDQGWADELAADTSGPAWRGLTVIGGRIIALFALGLLLLARASFRNRGLRRQVGIVWDIATFWPRHAHPLAPPCYAERAVPELSQRVAYLTDGDPTNDDPNFTANAVVVSAHSQGSVIAAAALLRQGQAVNRVVFLTYGSPLDRLYSRYFPAYFGPETTRVLAHRLDDRWVNLYRATDPIGGPIAAAALDWEVPVHVHNGRVEGHSHYLQETWYSDAIAQSEFWLSGRLYA